MIDARSPVAATAGLVRLSGCHALNHRRIEMVSRLPRHQAVWLVRQALDAANATLLDVRAFGGHGATLHLLVPAGGWQALLDGLVMQAPAMRLLDHETQNGPPLDPAAEISVALCIFLTSGADIQDTVPAVPG